MTAAPAEDLVPPAIDDAAKRPNHQRYGHYRRPIGRAGERPLVTTGHSAVLMSFAPAEVLAPFSDFPEAGGYPVGFLELAYRTMGVTNPAEVLHLCSGSVQAGITVDLRPEVRPDVVADCRNLPFADETFQWVMADPPYSRRWARQLYGLTKRWYPTPLAITREAQRVLRPGGRVGVLHYQVAPAPNFRSRGGPNHLSLVGVWGVAPAPGTHIRAWTVYEKKARQGELFEPPAVPLAPARRVWGVCAGCGAPETKPGSFTKYVAGFYCPTCCGLT